MRLILCGCQNLFKIHWACIWNLIELCVRSPKKEGKNNSNTQWSTLRLLNLAYLIWLFIFWNPLRKFMFVIRCSAVLLYAYKFMPANFHFPCNFRLNRRKKKRLVLSTDERYQCRIKWQAHNFHFGLAHKLPHNTKCLTAAIAHFLLHFNAMKWYFFIQTNL